jgi:hypothetical protein
MARILLYLRRWNLARILWILLGVTLIGTALAEELFLLLGPGAVFLVLGITRKGCGCNQC